PSASDATRKAYNDEFQSLLKSLQSFADNATFDGENILNGKVNGARPTAPATLPPLDFLANADATETITMNRQDLSLVGLGLELTGGVLPNLLQETDAAWALQAVELALTTASGKLAELGAQSKQIEKHTLFVTKLMDSLEVG